MEVTYFMPEGMKKTRHPAILVVHGWGGNGKSYFPLAERLQKIGFVVAVVALSGQDGGASRSRNMKELRKAYAILKGHNSVDPDRIGAYGASYGAYLLSVLASRVRFRWLALRAPALYPDWSFGEPMKLVLERNLKRFRIQHSRRSNRALSGVSRFRGDFMVLESGNDDYIPKSLIRSFIATARNARSVRHDVMLGADHALSRRSWKKHAVAIIFAWFKERFKEAKKEVHGVKPQTQPRV